MAFKSSFLMKLLLIQCFLPLLCLGQDFDFFYFVLQWPGSYCDSSQGCCYPKTGKPPATFGIHGLWPNYNDGSYPSNCDSSNPFDQSQISDLISRMQHEWPTLACPSATGIKFWSHEWNKHGTCSESVLDQHSYFASALKLKNTYDILSILQNAGFSPDGGQYSLDDITDAIKNGTGFTPGVECNVDSSSGNSQLYQIYICVDKSGSDLIECPVLPRGKCPSEVVFPDF